MVFLIKPYKLSRNCMVFACDRCLFRSPVLKWSVEQSLRTNELDSRGVARSPLNFNRVKVISPPFSGYTIDLNI